MKLNTEYFRLLAEHSHHALLLVALSLGDKRDAPAMRELLPVFLNDMPKSPLFAGVNDAPVLANDTSDERKASFVDAFERVLRPTEGLGPGWTLDQAAFFQEVMPYLKKQFISARHFLSSAVKTVQDPALLQLLEHAHWADQPDYMGVFEHTLLMNSAGALNEPVFSALLEKIDPSLVRTWLEDADESQFTQKKLMLMSTLEACWKDTAMRPVIDKVMRGLDDNLAIQARIQMLADLMAPPAGLKGRNEQWREQDTIELLAAENYDDAMQKVRAFAQIYSDTQSAEAITKSMQSAKYGPCLVLLADIALKGHWVPLLEATAPIFKTVGSDYDPYPVVMAGQSLDMADFKATVAFLESMGHPLTTQPVVLGERAQVSALAHLAKSPNLDNWQGKLAVLLDLGADPSVPDHEGKKPMDLVKPKARREEWKGVVVSHAARRAAMDAIKEIAADEHWSPSP